MNSKKQLTEVIRSQNIAVIIQNLGVDATIERVNYYLDMGLIHNNYQLTEDDLEVLSHDPYYLTLYEQVINYEDLYNSIIMYHMEMGRVSDIHYELLKWYTQHVNREHYGPIEYMNHLLSVVYSIVFQIEDDGEHKFITQPIIPIQSLEQRLSLLSINALGEGMTIEQEDYLSQDLGLVIQKLTQGTYPHKKQLIGMIQGYYNYIVFSRIN